MNRKGQGGPIHRPFQQEVKKDAESKGYQVTIEKCLGDKRADIGIETDRGIVACEISLSIPDKEFQNLVKDLDAGFVQVIACCKDQQQIRMIKALVEEKLSPEQQAKISFFLLSHYVIHDSQSVCDFVR